jgi:hypothetical protein
MYLMKHSLSLAVILIGLMGLFFPRCAQAQAPNPSAAPVFPLNEMETFRYSDARGMGSITFLDLGPDLVTGFDLLKYSDARGMGSITFVDLGPDLVTGFDLLKVTLSQNRVSFHGSGIATPIPGAARPLTNLVSFTVVGPKGVAYCYQGKMGLGVEYQGEGTYHPISDPTQSATWGLLALPLPPGGGGGPTPHAAAGIQGVAMAGPIAPVVRPGQPNTRPLPGAIITMQPAGGGAEIARATADGNGQFRIPLAPGSYLMVPLPPQPGAFLPRGTPQTVTVPPGVFVNLTVQYDTGIR